MGGTVSEKGGRPKRSLLPPLVEYLTVLRALGWLGSALLVVGALASIASAALTPDDLHYEYTAEHLILLSLGILSSFLVHKNSLRGLGYVGWISAIIILICVSAEIGKRLATPIPGQGATGLSLVRGRTLEAISHLWHSHIGWPSVIVAILVLIVVGNRAGTYKIHSQLGRRPADRQGQLLLRRYEVLAEVAKAPIGPLLCGAILILLGIVILFAGGDVSLSRKLTGALISEFGFAFFIAYVLGITLEIHAKREHERAVRRGLLSAAWGVDLDNELFAATAKYIFEPKLYRRQVSTEYDFLKATDDWMLLKYSLTYTIENVGENAVKHMVEASVEKSPAPEALLEPGMKYGIRDIFIDGERLSDDDMRVADETAADDNKYTRVAHPVPLMPGETKQIRLIFITAKRTEDNELWRTMIACASATLRVTWPSNIPLELFADPVHPCDKFDFENLDLLTRSFTATIETPLFPHNGFLFWWRLKKAAPNPAPPSGGQQGDSSGAEG